MLSRLALSLTEDEVLRHSVQADVRHIASLVPHPCNNVDKYKPVIYIHDIMV